MVLSTCFIEFGISGDVAFSRKNWCALFVNGPDSLVYFSSACCHFHGLNCLNPIDNISNTVLFHHVFPLQFSYVFCYVCVYKPMRLTNFFCYMTPFLFSLHLLFTDFLGSCYVYSLMTWTNPSLIGDGLCWVFFFFLVSFLFVGWSFANAVMAVRCCCHFGMDDASTRFGPFRCP